MENISPVINNEIEKRWDVVTALSMHEAKRRYPVLTREQIAQVLENFEEKWELVKKDNGGYLLQSGNKEMECDVNGRLVRETELVGGKGREFIYEHDGLGRVVKDSVYVINRGERRLESVDVFQYPGERPEDDANPTVVSTDYDKNGKVVVDDGVI